MRYQKWLACIAVFFLMSFPLIASAELTSARYPEKNQTLCDHANLFSDEVIVKLGAAMDSIQEQAHIQLWVVTVHFLDGLGAYSYAQGLFTHWELGADDLLLLLVAGEDTFVSYAGEDVLPILSSQTQQHLLSSYLEPAFLRFSYDEALSSYLKGLTDHLNKQLLISLPGAWTAPVTTAAPNTLSAKEDLLWPSTREEPFDQKAFEEKNANASSEPKKINAGQVFFIVLLALIFFGNKEQRKMATSAGCWGLGCGCSPLGWLFAALGISKFFSKNKKNAKNDHIYQ
ncbi:MAG: TPM domain-containing protein [Clostridiales bacterium]|nr:TPM domain-containing protein [Clostridiales bacterium]